VEWYSGRLRQKPKPSEAILYRSAFLRRARKQSYCGFVPVRRNPDRQAIEFFDVSYPTGLGDKPVIPFHTITNMLVRRVHGRIIR
jgi:hypothetical protein